MWYCQFSADEESALIVAIYGRKSGEILEFDYNSNKIYHCFPMPNRYQIGM